MPAAERRPVRFLVVAASLRAASLNARLAALAADVIAERGGVVDRATMADFDSPSYDGDVETEAGMPAGAEALVRRLRDADAFVLASPEYNASMPGVLKNAIDWASRARPQPFNGKQGMLLSASPSMVGGNRGLWALRVPLEHLGARVYPDMFSLAQAHHALDDAGRIADATVRDRFERTLGCFMELVEAATLYPAMKKDWVEFLGERPDAATDREERAPAHAA